MDITKLTPEEKAALKAQLDNEEKQEKKRVARERETYKNLVDTMVSANVAKLKELSRAMEDVKNEVFDEFATLIKTKDELFKTKSDRQSDTFTTSDGQYTITLGRRINEGWDDTVENGILKVMEFVKTLAKDETSSALVETILGLIAKNKRGELKASKVLELEKLANRMQDPDFLDGISIIKEAYRPVPTCQFITVHIKDEKGVQSQLPLSLSNF